MRSKDVGLLVLRAVAGGTLAAHGAQKLLGAFGGPGPEGAADAFRAMGLPRPEQAVVAASACEVGGGLLLASGLATPIGGAAAVGAMRVAADVHARNGFFNQRGGYEYPLLLGTVGATLALTGPGALSLDRLLGHRLARPWLGAVGCAVALAAGTAVARSRRAVAPPAEDDVVVDVRDEDWTQVEVEVNA